MLFVHQFQQTLITCSGVDLKEKIETRCRREITTHNQSAFSPLIIQEFKYKVITEQNNLCLTCARHSVLSTFFLSLSLSRLSKTDSVLQVSSHLDGFFHQSRQLLMKRKRSSYGPYSSCQRKHHLSHILLRCAHQIPPKKKDRGKKGGKKTLPKKTNKKIPLKYHNNSRVSLKLFVSSSVGDDLLSLLTSREEREGVGACRRTGERETERGTLKLCLHANRSFFSRPGRKGKDARCREPKSGHAVGILIAEMTPSLLLHC